MRIPGHGGLVDQSKLPNLMVYQKKFAEQQFGSDWRTRKK